MVRWRRPPWVAPTSHGAWLLVVAVALSVAASISGVLISYHLNASIGASIVLCQAAGFLLMLGLRLVVRRG